MQEDVSDVEAWDTQDRSQTVSSENHGAIVVCADGICTQWMLCNSAINSKNTRISLKIRFRIGNNRRLYFLNMYVVGGLIWRPTVVFLEVT